MNTIKRLLIYMLLAVLALATACASDGAEPALYDGEVMSFTHPEKWTVDDDYPEMYIMVNSDYTHADYEDTLYLYDVTEDYLNYYGDPMEWAAALMESELAIFTDDASEPLAAINDDGKIHGNATVNYELYGHKFQVHAFIDEQQNGMLLAIMRIYESKKAESAYETMWDIIKTVKLSGNHP